jgi:hypothetical protein
MDFQSSVITLGGNVLEARVRLEAAPRPAEGGGGVREISGQITRPDRIQGRPQVDREYPRVPHSEQITGGLGRDSCGIALSWIRYLNPQTEELPVAARSRPLRRNDIENVEDRT